MDPTTLVTFLFRAPAEARTVELLGSWDNFAQPYRMHNDRRRGIWSGIFKFENISYDGNGVRWTKPRSGGLRQGATYWYYYRLNSYDDTFDDRQPRTLSCPLIPGQVVNIMDVPIELVELPARCHSSSDIEGSLTNWQQFHTLDPAAKYATLEPPPLSKTHARSLSDGTVKGRLEHQRLSILEETVSRPTTPRFEGFISADRNYSRSGISRDSSVYSRETSCSAALTINEGVDGAFHSIHGPNHPDLTLYPLSEVAEVSDGSVMEPQTKIAAAIDNADTWTTERGPDSPNVKAYTYNPRRKLSTLSIGPISVQNIQFYNESRPGTMLNEDPEQHRPRVYSLPTSEVKSSDEGSPQVSPITTALQRSVTNDNQEENGAPESDIAELDLGSPSFSLATASSDGGESPLHLSPQNSLKRNTRSASRSGRAFTGFANRIRSIRKRQDSLLPQGETEQPPTLSLPAFINYALPPATESTHSLAKSHSNFSTHNPSAHGQIPAPSVFDAELPVRSHFPEETGSSMADAIFSELGYLSASIA